MTQSAPLPIVAYRQVQLKFDQDLLRILEQSAKAIRARVAKLTVKNGVGARVRAQQLSLVLHQIKEIQHQLWTQKLYDTVVTGRKEAMQAAQDALEAASRALYAQLPAGVADALIDSLSETALSGLRSDQARVPRALSSRVYNNRDLANGKINDLIRQGLVQGLSARELAATVYKYVSPNTPGGQSYAAMRLARTEINNAFHERQIAAGKGTPGVTGIKWNLSSSHPKTDVCNAYASTDHASMGSGVYKPTNVPEKPHPHCFCYLTYITMSSKDLLAGLRSGKFDDELERRTQENLRRLGVKPTPNARTLRSVPKTDPVAKAKAHLSSIPDLPEGSSHQAQLIADELLSQAKLTPEAMLKLQKIKGSKAGTSFGDAFYQDVGRECFAYYTYGNNVYADTFHINLSPAWFDSFDAMESIFQQMAAKRWLVSAGPDKGLESTIAHEYGHHVTKMITGGSRTQIAGDVAEPLLGALKRELGMKGFPGGKTAAQMAKEGVTGQELADWFALNKGLITTKVSEYASDSFEECLAEIWCEFSTLGKKARPELYRLGLLLQKMAERKLKK